LVVFFDVSAGGSEIEALVVLQRKRFRFVEVPCRFRRAAG
jgi:hypothetical protein